MFKNKVPFRSCMSKNKKIKIKENAENTVFLMYNLLQYSGNYFLTS